MIETQATISDRIEVKYMPQLDGIRAFAVAGVILDHWVSGLPKSIQTIAAALDLSSLGVQCFFVLSGFLITKLLLTDKATSSPKGTVLRRFYLRRFLRIFPIYYCTLLIAFLLIKDNRHELWWHALYLTNIYVSIQNSWPSFGGHFWSLAVEEQFYLLWPLVVTSMSVRNVTKVAIALIFLAPASRLLLASLYGPDAKVLYVGPLCTVDLLAVGAMFALTQSMQSVSPRMTIMRVHTVIGVVAVCSYLALIVLSSNVASAAFGRTLLALSFASLISLASKELPGIGGAILSNAPIVWLGTISYGLYVYHPFIPDSCITLFSAIGINIPSLPYYFRYPIFLSSLIATAWLSYTFIEQPIRTLGRRERRRM